MSPQPATPALERRFTARLQGFLDRLRDEGLRTGVGAGVDLSRALDALPPLDRSAFREACRTTLAKSPGELAVIDRVFDEYFGLLGAPVPPASEEGKLPFGRDRGGRAPSRPRAPEPERDDAEEELHGRFSPAAPAPEVRAPAISPDRLRGYRSGARRFRRAVATLPGRRWKAHPSGTVDLRRTARAGLRSGGEWMELARRARAARRADLVILWDVSGSMREHTAELFGLVYALQRVVRRTRVFAFGHELVEAGAALSGKPAVRAWPELAHRIRPTGGGTRIAHCLAEFRRRYGSELRRTSTVLVLSDGWDLGDAGALADELRRLRGQVHRLVWVNPYAAHAGFQPATAALKAALPYIDAITSPEDFPNPHGPAARDRRTVSVGLRLGTET